MVLNLRTRSFRLKEIKATCTAMASKIQDSNASLLKDMKVKEWKQFAWHRYTGGNAYLHECDLIEGANC